MDLLVTANKGFRPQQGLTIMNENEIRSKIIKQKFSFRPQQGLTIMNESKWTNL